VARTLANLGRYFASASEHALHVHQYADLTVHTRLDDGAEIGLQVRTGYPNDESVSVTLLRDLDSGVAVSLRVPAWARGHAVLYDGSEHVTANDETVVVHGPRPAGTRVTLTLPMAPRVTRPHPRIDAVRGQVAIERGPFVLAVEDVDLPDGVTVNDIAIDPDHVRPFGDGAQVPVLLTEVADVGGALPYADEVPVSETPSPGRPVATFRPYYQWANRGPSTMRVWTPTLVPR